VQLRRPVLPDCAEESHGQVVENSNAVLNSPQEMPERRLCLRASTASRKRHSTALVQVFSAVVSLISSASFLPLSSHSTLRLLLRRLAARRLARNRLLPVLLAAAQQLQVASPAGQSLLGHGLQACGVLLVDGVGADEDGLFGLDDFVAGLDALRTTITRMIVSTAGCLSVVEDFVRFGRDLLLGLGFLELGLRHFCGVFGPRFLGGVVWVGMCVWLLGSESGWAGC
jgi:hypothetical protein